MNITDSIKKVLNKGKNEIITKYIPEANNQFTNTLMNVYELGIRTGIEVENIRYNNELVNDISEWLEDYFQDNNLGSPFTKMSMISELKKKFKKEVK